MEIVLIMGEVTINSLPFEKIWWEPFAPQIARVHLAPARRYEKVALDEIQLDPPWARLLGLAPCIFAVHFSVSIDTKKLPGTSSDGA
jgi:hypothetical protein